MLIWHAIQGNHLSNELNWLDVIHRLSHFVIDHDISEKGTLPPYLSVFENILCRGLPTLPSLYVEKKLEELTGLVHLKEVGKNEVAAFKSRINKDVYQTAVPIIEQALCTVSPKAKLSPSPGFCSFDFESDAERIFWEGPLTELLGPGGIQLVSRQRSLETILGASFREQRVDFSAQLPGTTSSLPKGIIFEVDGPEHGHQQRKLADSKRDTACVKAGWAKTYRHRLWRGVDAFSSIHKIADGVKEILKHPYLLRINKNTTTPLLETVLGAKAHKLALMPFAIARIQRVFLELIKGGTLSLNDPEWEIIVLDRDNLPGCGTVAAEDFSIWLSRILSIFNPKQPIPRIHIYEFSDGTQVPQYDKASVLLDVSVLLRYGASLPDPPSLKTSGLTRVTIRSDYFK